MCVCVCDILESFLLFAGGAGNAVAGVRVIAPGNIKTKSKPRPNPGSSSSSRPHGDSSVFGEDDAEDGTYIDPPAVDESAF
jgi:hypothetical protein